MILLVIAIVAALTYVVVSFTRVAVNAILRPNFRVPMVVSGVLVALPIVAFQFGYDVVFLGLPGFIGGYMLYPLVLMLGLVEGPTFLAFELLVMAVYWVINTALLGALLAVLWRRRARTRPRTPSAASSSASACGAAD